MASAAEQLAANMNFGAFAKATDLHKRLWFTLSALLVYRLGTYVPIPGIDSGRLRRRPSRARPQGILGMFNMFSGGAVERMAIFALNVMPYISASIIVQLMGTVYPPWEKLQQGRRRGRPQAAQPVHPLPDRGAGPVPVVRHRRRACRPARAWSTIPGLFFIVSTVVTLTGGTMFLMWLGEQITSRGVGNGISLIIFAGIVAVLPRAIVPAVRPGPARAQMSAFALLLIVRPGRRRRRGFIVFMERAQRRLLIQYPKRQAGQPHVRRRAPRSCR